MIDEEIEPSPYIKTNEDGSKTMTLQFPFKWLEEELVKELVFKRPKGKHIKGMSKDVSFDDIMRIATKVSSYTPKFFEELDAADCLTVSEVIGDFLDSGPPTGKTV